MDNSPILRAQSFSLFWALLLYADPELVPESDKDNL